MGINSETLELLSGFEKRMKFMNITRYLLEYSYKENIKNMVPERDVLNNAVMAVLVFIKEMTLGKEQKCTLNDVAGFLDEIKDLFFEDKQVDTNELARFIVVDVLQKGGVLTNYKVFISDKNKFKRVPVRLVEEESGSYHLTDDGFDFLFRSKEIDSELDYSVTRFRLSEYMKRDNYVEALNQSRELVSRIRSMKISMDDFVRRCKENIAKVSIDQYESVVSRVRNLLDSEYEELRNIQENAKSRADSLTEALENGVEQENIRKHRKALNEIVQNIQMTIEEQRSLINKKMSISDKYKNILNDGYAINRYERLDFDMDILALIRSGKIPLTDAAQYILHPLIKPKLTKYFNLESLYERQDLIIDNENTQLEKIGEEVESVDSAEIKNARFQNICAALFEYIASRSSFKFSEFIASLDGDMLQDFCVENALLQVILDLYSSQTICIDAWKKQKELVVEPVGEFELSWCLTKLPENYLDIKEFSVYKCDRVFTFEVCENDRKNIISMTDFVIEVVK